MRWRRRAVLPRATPSGRWPEGLQHVSAELLKSGGLAPCRPTATNGRSVDAAHRNDPQMGSSGRMSPRHRGASRSAGRAHELIDQLASKMRLRKSMSSALLKAGRIGGLTTTRQHFEPSPRRDVPGHRQRRRRGDRGWGRAHDGSDTRMCRVRIGARSKCHRSEMERWAPRIARRQERDSDERGGAWRSPSAIRSTGATQRTDLVLSTERLTVTVHRGVRA